MENLDLKCAEVGKQIAQDSELEERLLNQALGVLEEQGVYAFFLYLDAQRKEAASKVSAACRQFLQKNPNGNPLLQDGDQWKTLRKLGENLDSLLFARDLLRQVLIYARYHLRAKAEGGG